MSDLSSIFDAILAFLEQLFSLIADFVAALNAIDDGEDD